MLSAIVLLSLVLLWMRSSRRCLEIRAIMMNPQASIVGIGVRQTGLSVTALTGSLGGLAAVLLAQTYYVAPSAASRPW